MGNLASKCTWVFGTDPDKASVPSEGNRTHGGHNNVVGSTGAGATFNTHRLGELFSFAVETNDSGWAYQLRTARTSSGPWAVLSSNSGTSTTGTDVFQCLGPLGWLSPRMKSMASTANYLIVQMTALEG
jgi:hypothetical protein